MKMTNQAEIEETATLADDSSGCFSHMMRKWQKFCCRKTRVLPVMVLLSILLILLNSELDIQNCFKSHQREILHESNYSNSPLIIVITPTYKRFVRIAEMTRVSNTFSHVENLHWIVVEDNYELQPIVERLLDRSRINYTYMAHKTINGYPKRGWYQRNMALKYIRENWKRLLRNHPGAVIYFADDDNTYDIRLFNDYIRNVKKVGMWAVGFSGGTIVEGLSTNNGKVTGFRVKWGKKRPFPVDMAGFAVNLQVVLSTSAEFGKSCQRGGGAPESCLLLDMGLKIEDIEPFGQDSNPKEVLVWHTKTQAPNLRYNKNRNFSKDVLLDYDMEV